MIGLLTAIIQRGDDAGPARVVIAPYRICPIGAHSDHQGGPTLAMAVSAHTRMTFTPARNPTLTVTSAIFPGDVEVDLTHPVPEGGWGSYVAAAVLALREWLPQADALGGFIGWLAERRPVFTHEMWGSRLDVGQSEGYARAEIWLKNGV